MYYSVDMNKRVSSGPPSSERALGKRRAIVEAAQSRFLSEGYETSVDAIADDANVSKATVYNHFGSKESLFIAVIRDALDVALGEAVDEARKQLATTEGARAALTETARALVHGVAQPAVLALRNLVTGELRRFPELGEAWETSGPRRAATMVRELLERFIDQNELRIEDIDIAVIQLFALTLYPHLTAGSYGKQISDAASERLITSGIDVFLSRYGV